MAERARIRRTPSRGHYDRQALNDVLDAGLIAHVGIAMNGQPFVLPMAYCRMGEHIYLHGSQASRLVTSAGAGVPLCITVTLLDGLVLARSGLHHSVNYRSAVIFGRGEVVDEGPEKVEILNRTLDHITPRRSEEVRQPSELESRATLIVRVTIEDYSVKIRRGPPKGDDHESAESWSGVVPLRVAADEPIPAAGCLHQGLPASVRALGERFLRGRDGVEGAAARE